MRKQKEISNADRELFRHSVGNVSRIRNRPTIMPVRNSSTPRPVTRQFRPIVQSSTDHPPSPTVGMGDVLNYRRSGVQKRTLTRLKKGRITPESVLDLHGMTENAAQKKLLAFLERCKHESVCCIRIIHGKGRGSRDNIPVIKNLLNNLLRNRDDVLAFTSAPVSDGGTGVVYVLLNN